MAKIISLTDSLNTQLITSESEDDQAFLKRIILASVDKKRIHPEMFRGVLFYPTETMLRKDRLAKQIENIVAKKQLQLDYGKNTEDVLIIWLDELINNKCKQCHGKGFVSYDVPDPAMFQEIINIIENCIENFDESFQDTITEFCKVGIQQDVLEAFLQQLHSEYIHKGKLNKPAIIMLAKHIREYMIKFRPVYCTKCVLPNYNKKIAELKLESKFTKSNLIL